MVVPGGRHGLGPRAGGSADPNRLLSSGTVLLVRMISMTLALRRTARTPHRRPPAYLARLEALENRLSAGDLSSIYVGAVGGAIPVHAVAGRGEVTSGL